MPKRITSFAALLAVGFTLAACQEEGGEAEGGSETEESSGAESEGAEGDSQ